MEIVLTWFRINSLQTNPGKFQFMIIWMKKPNSVKSRMLNNLQIQPKLKKVKK